MASVTPSQLRLQTQLQARLGPKLAIVCSGVDGDPGTLWPEERVAIRQAIPRRQREFAAGRSAARSAMQQLGWQPGPVPANPDRSPRWPEGLIGTISHSATTCVVILARQSHWQSIGIDIEPDTGIEASLWNTICSRGERDWLLGQPEHGRSLLATRIFTAKEAFYKSRSSREQSKLDFQNCSTEWTHLGPDLMQFQMDIDGVSGESPVGYCMKTEGAVVAWVLQAAPTDRHPGGGAGTGTFPRIRETSTLDT